MFINFPYEVICVFVRFYMAYMIIKVSCFLYFTSQPELCILFALTWVFTHVSTLAVFFTALVLLRV